MWSLSIRPRLSSEGQRRFALLFRFDSRAEELLEVSFLDEPLDGAVVDQLLEVEGLEIGSEPGVGLLRDDRP